MNKSIVGWFMLLVIAPGVLADDEIQPPWPREIVRTTFQVWDSWSYDAANAVYPAEPGFFNPYYKPGTPTDGPAIVEPAGTAVVGQYDGRQQVITVPDGDWLEIHIPNSLEPRDTKDIYMQIVWHWDGAPDIPDVYYPTTGVTISLLEEHHFGEIEGWWYTRFHIHIEPNPEREEIDVWPVVGGGPLIVDQVVIDTLCGPVEDAELQLEPGPAPGQVTLTWEGAQPDYTVVRSEDSSTVRQSGDVIDVTSGYISIDEPPAEGLHCYVVKGSQP